MAHALVDWLVDQKYTVYFDTAMVKPNVPRWCCDIKKLGSAWRADGPTFPLAVARSAPKFGRSNPRTPPPEVPTPVPRTLHLEGRAALEVMGLGHAQRLSPRHAR